MRFLSRIGKAADDQLIVFSGGQFAGSLCGFLIEPIPHVWWPRLFL
jgi:hypothetical protein